MNKPNKDIKVHIYWGRWNKLVSHMPLVLKSSQMGPTCVMTMAYIQSIIAMISKKLFLQQCIATWQTRKIIAELKRQWYIRHLYNLGKFLVHRRRVRHPEERAPHACSHSTAVIVPSFTAPPCPEDATLVWLRSGNTSEDEPLALKGRHTAK
jgi:hypothetical protein